MKRIILNEGHIMRLFEEASYVDFLKRTNELNKKLSVGEVDILLGLSDDKVETEQSHLKEPNYGLGTNGHKNTVTYNNDKVLEYLLYIDPSNAFCPGAGNCAKTCLTNSGNMATSAAQKARKAKHDLFLNDREGFMLNLIRDLNLFVEYGEQEKKLGNIMGYFVRLNGTSDLSVEDAFVLPTLKKNILELFPNLQFVDYTKVYKGGKGTRALLNGEITNDESLGNSKERMKMLSKMPNGNGDTYKKKKYSNYFVVYSYDGETHTSNKLDCEDWLENGDLITVIFDDYFGRLPIPKTYTFGGKEYKVIIGDFSDAVHLVRRKYHIPDDEGAIIALSYKKSFGAKLCSNLDKNGEHKFPAAVDLAKYYGINRKAIWDKNKNATWCQKHLWPELAKKGFDFYNYRVRDMKGNTPHMEFVNNEWVFIPAIEDKLNDKSTIDTSPMFKESIDRNIRRLIQLLK